MIGHRLTGLAALAESTKLSTHALGAARLTCQLTDPGCYIDDFAHKQLYQFALSIWQINRAGLVLARWLEDLRIWLTDSVLADAFTTLTQPVKFLFFLVLIVAWLVFVISFMVQSFVDLRWVDLRRAMRPILLALFLFSAGGSLLKGSEYARLLGGSLLQQAARQAVQAVQAPPVPTENTGDMADASASIYGSPSSCGTPARAQATMFLNDYDARYLWASADDIHCAEIKALAGEFYSIYYPYGQIISGQEPDTRQRAIAAAAQGGMRQVTGVFMTGGALIEQFVQLLFAVSLALVWFGILLSLVFAVFVPAEALLSGQLRALFAVLRASWLASFLLGLGLAVLQIVAESGNGTLVFICGLALIAVAIWQGKQALETMGAALSALGAATGSAPQAVGGMLRSWATTAALVAGVAATGGGLGLALGSVGSTMVRRAGRSAGDNPLAKAASRVLSNRVAGRLDAYTQEQRMEQDADLSAAEAAWYERDEYAGAGTPAAADADVQASAARERSFELQARVLDRRAERARQARSFARASQLRREAAKLRAGRAQPPTAVPAHQPELEGDPLELALEQLHEAGDAHEQRGVLADTAAQAQRQALAENTVGAANESNGHPLPLAGSLAAARQPRRWRHAIRSNPSLPAIGQLDREIAALVRQIAGLQSQAEELAHSNAPHGEPSTMDVESLSLPAAIPAAVDERSSAARVPEPDGAVAKLAELQHLLVSALERRSVLQPQADAQAAEAGRPAAVVTATVEPFADREAGVNQPLPAGNRAEAQIISGPPALAGAAAPWAGQYITPLSSGSIPLPANVATAAVAESLQLVRGSEAAPPTVQAQKPQRPAGSPDAQAAQPGALSAVATNESAPIRSVALAAPALAPQALAAALATPAQAAASPIAQPGAPETRSPLRPAQAPADSQPPPAVAAPAAARRTPDQPARAMAGLALPQLAEARGRNDAPVAAARPEAVAARPAPNERAAAAPARQPWKRGKQGDS